MPRKEVTMQIIPLVAAMAIILILSALSYFLLLTANNIIWGYRRIPVEKESPVYKKRKRTLKFISIPTAILLLIIIGLSRSPSLKDQGEKTRASFGYPIYLSPLGFSVNIPSHWRVTNSKLLMEDPNREKAMNVLFDAMKVPESQKKEIIAALRTGQMEYWHYRDTPNNVTCRKKRGRGVIQKSDFGEFREKFKKVGNEAQVHDLGLKRIAGLDMFYYDFSGLVHGLKMLQANIQLTPTEYMQFSLTAQNNIFENIKDDFWEIVSTFKAL
jgi:hypothetical protein